LAWQRLGLAWPRLAWPSLAWLWLGLVWLGLAWPGVPWLKNTKFIGLGGGRIPKSKYGLTEWFKEGLKKGLNKEPFTQKTPTFVNKN
jgi:hypothetical protein